MAEQFLLPEDVSAENARMVLDFLNQAASAEIIAEAVEFPNELDVGVRVAQRILRRRAELNTFTTLDQVYAVPYVGPERFTEIVVSLSGARPPRRTDVTESQLTELRRSVDALRAMLTPSVQARLWAVQDTMWLGQNATLLVQVTEGGGRPLIDQAVTLTTSWGELEATNGLQVLAGNTVVTRTNEVGLAQLRLRTRFQASLSDAQRLALELAAGQLPLTAPWPTVASAELGDLIQRYRAPGSDDLREAVDAAFREYGASLEQSAHRGQALAQWAQVPVSIACFVHDDGDERGQRHLALVTHTLMVRNWLPAFLATFEDTVATDRALAAELKRAPRDAKDATGFLNDVFVSVQSFVNAERGELGQTIRNRAAQRDLQQFLQTSISGLATDVRLDALVGVRNASKTIGDGGLPLFTAVDANRRDIKSKLDINTGALADRLSTLERTTVTTQLVDDLRGQLLLKADRVSVDALTATTATLRQDINRKADRTSIDALTAETGALRQDFNTAAANSAGLRADVSNISTSFTGLNARVTRDLTTLGTRVDTIDTTLRGRG